MDKIKGQCKIPAIIEENVTVQLFKEGKSVLDKDGNPIVKEQVLWFCKFHFRAMVYQDTRRLVLQELQNQTTPESLGSMVKQLDLMRKEQHEAIKKQ